MALLGKLLPNLLSNISRFPTSILTNSFHGVTNTTNALVPGGFFTLSVRNKIRCYFPRPSERKRIKRHGWWHRMSTLEGRRILMRRILKGRHALSH